MGWYERHLCPHCGHDYGGWICSIKSGLGPGQLECARCEQTFNTSLVEWREMSGMRQMQFWLATGAYCGALGLGGFVLGTWAEAALFGEPLGRLKPTPWSLGAAAVIAALVAVFQLLRIRWSVLRSRAGSPPLRRRWFSPESHLHTKTLALVFTLAMATTLVTFFRTRTATQLQFPADAVRRLKSLNVELDVTKAGVVEHVELDARNIGVPGAMRALKEVGRLRGLKSLRLEIGTLKDEDLAGLGKLTALQSLQIVDAEQFTGSGLRHVANGELRVLNLQNTGLRAEHFQSLGRFPRLQTVYVHGADLHPDVLDEFRKRHPQTDVKTESHLFFRLPVFD